MKILPLPPGHRSGFVAVIGRPNVGKSTLVNRYLGQSVAPVSPRPQTTRRRQLGILTLPAAQVIFIDTPGIHSPHNRLGEYMNTAATIILNDADLLLPIFDISAEPGEDDMMVVERLAQMQSPPPILVVLNKTDQVSEEQLSARQTAYTDMLPAAASFTISATTGENCPELLAELVARLPEGPRFYDAEEITDTFERDIAADLIRSAALHLLRNEVPYSIAVRIDEYKERGDRGAYIEATIFVERNSQKGIVIGKQGSMLREIGKLARQEIEGMSGRKVFLSLHVKVLPKWRNDPEALIRFGYSTAKK